MQVYSLAPAEGLINTASPLLIGGHASTLQNGVTASSPGSYPGNVGSNPASATTENGDFTVFAKNQAYMSAPL